MAKSQRSASMPMTTITIMTATTCATSEKSRPASGRKPLEKLGTGAEFCDRGDGTLVGDQMSMLFRWNQSVSAFDLKESRTPVSPNRNEHLFPERVAGPTRKPGAQIRPPFSPIKVNVRELAAPPFHFPLLGSDPLSHRRPV
jgi:hypothetical protein